eukprot:977283-Pleurochrysis_carterae.AAC.1
MEGAQAGVKALKPLRLLHIQGHCSAQFREVCQIRKIRNGAAYLVTVKMSAKQTLKAVSVVGSVG